MKATTRPDIILIMTDQQRFDSIGALGAGWAHTPNLDRLVREGLSCSNCFYTAPSCVPSRASFFNMQFPNKLSVFHNGDRWERSWVESLQDQGYHTVNIGKMHTVPFDAPCGFDRRLIVENKDRPRGKEYYHDEWDRFLLNSGVDKPNRETYKATHPEYKTALGAYRWELDERFQSDIFTGNMARWYLEQLDSERPLFLQIGFPGPHPPYDPPQRFLGMIDPDAIPIPRPTAEELTAQPDTQQRYRQEMIRGNHDAVRWHEQPTPEQLRRLWHYYGANVSLIDEQIGGILDTLQERGRLDDAILIFTSDHGDCLGEHGHIQKWTMYDSILRAPMIIRAPGRVAAGSTTDALLQQFDLVPWLFRLAGLNTPETHDAINADDAIVGNGTGRRTVFAEHGACNMVQGVEYFAMARDRRWKVVAYAGRSDGELYDLEQDPDEQHNRWGDDNTQAVKQDLLRRLQAWQTT